MPRLVGCGDHVLPGKFDPSDETMENEEIWGLDLGSGVWISPFSDYQEPFARAREEADHVGGIVWHVHEDGRVCGGAVYFKPARDGGPVWDVQSWDPLTITPSVLARGNFGGTECLHGWITDGRWVSC